MLLLVVVLVSLLVLLLLLLLSQGLMVGTGSWGAFVSFACSSFKLFVQLQIAGLIRSFVVIWFLINCIRSTPGIQVHMRECWYIT